MNLVRARNIRTVGNLSSLTEKEVTWGSGLQLVSGSGRQCWLRSWSPARIELSCISPCSQVQTLPIRSPKVETLRSTLQSFEQQLKSATVSFVVDSVLLNINCVDVNYLTEADIDIYDVLSMSLLSFSQGGKRRPSVESEQQPPSKVQKTDQAEGGSMDVEEDSLADTFTQTQPASPSSVVTLSAPNTQDSVGTDLESKAADFNGQVSVQHAEEEEKEEEGELSQSGGEFGSGRVEREGEGVERKGEGVEREDEGMEEEEEEGESGEGVEGDGGREIDKDGVEGGGDKMEADTSMDDGASGNDEIPVEDSDAHRVQTVKV